MSGRYLRSLTALPHLEAGSLVQVTVADVVMGYHQWMRQLHYYAALSHDRGATPVPARAMSNDEAQSMCVST